MGDRGNRWQKSITEKKTNFIRIMFLMVVGTHVSSLVLLFWHVCLAHIDANLLSSTLCGPHAQPCGSSPVSNTWVCSNRNCQISSLFTTRVHPMLSDARLGKQCLVSGSLQVCGGSVRLQKPSAKLELYSSRQKPSCRSLSNGCYSLSILLGRRSSVTQKLTLLPLQSNGLTVKQIKHFKLFCMLLITCSLCSLALSHHGSQWTFPNCDFPSSFLPPPPVMLFMICYGQ